MDKLLIVLGIVFLYGAYAEKQQAYFDTAFSIAKDKATLTLLGLLAVLFLIAKYNPKMSGFPALIALLVALNIGLKK